MALRSPPRSGVKFVQLPVIFSLVSYLSKDKLVHVVLVIYALMLGLLPTVAQDYIDEYLP